MSAGLASEWWRRPIPLDHPLAQRAIAFGNEVGVVAEWFANGAYFTIRCSECGLPEPLCRGKSSKRCYARRAAQRGALDTEAVRQYQSRWFSLKGRVK